MNKFPSKILSLFFTLLLMGLNSCSARSLNSTNLSENSAHPSLPLSRAVFDASSLSFVPHDGRAPGSAYLVQDLPYPPVAALRTQLEEELAHPIKNRGEAHITVITPPEYDQALKAYLSITEINRMAQEAKILNLPFEPLCVGEGSALLDGRRETTYFIVVQSERLLELRRQLAKAFQAKGGSPEAFDPEDYHPHITLGFTKRDLFAQDGVRKDSSSCRQGVTLTEQN